MRVLVVALPRVQQRLLGSVEGGARVAQLAPAHLQREDVNAELGEVRQPRDARVCLRPADQSDGFRPDELFEEVVRQGRARTPDVQAVQVKRVCVRVKRARLGLLDASNLSGDRAGALGFFNQTLSRAPVRTQVARVSQKLAEAQELPRRGGAPVEVAELRAGHAARVRAERAQHRGVPQELKGLIQPVAGLQERHGVVELVRVRGDAAGRRHVVVERRDWRGAGGIALLRDGAFKRGPRGTDHESAERGVCGADGRHLVAARREVAGNRVPRAKTRQPPSPDAVAVVVRYRLLRLKTRIKRFQTP